MSDVVSLAQDNILSPPILFFLLGFGAGLLRSDLSIPDAIGKALALYLMAAIGFKGGAALGANGIESSVLAALVLGAALGFAMPVIGFALLRLTSRFDATTAAAVSAHYGSVSAVTFVTAAAFLDLEGVGYEGWMIAVMAVMETPAIITGLVLAKGRFPWNSNAGSEGSSRARLLREVFLNGSVVVLIGSFAIGWATGETGLESVAPFVVDPFVGVLCFFLLDMGLVASGHLTRSSGLSLPVVGFAFYMPVLGAGLGLVSAHLAGLSVGGTTLLMVLAASASYIAVPAAMRVALPQANAGVSMTLSMAITFPFNVVVGIPLYFALGRYFVGG